MLGEVERRPSQKQRMGGNRERKIARNGGVRGGGVRRSVARTRGSTGGYGQKKPTESGCFFKEWWWNREPNPRPPSESGGNALALRTWIRRFGRYAGARAIRMRPIQRLRATGGQSHRLPQGVISTTRNSRNASITTASASAPRRSCAGRPTTACSSARPGQTHRSGRAAGPTEYSYPGEARIRCPPEEASGGIAVSTRPAASAPVPPPYPAGRARGAPRSPPPRRPRPGARRLRGRGGGEPRRAGRHRGQQRQHGAREGDGDGEALHQLAEADQEERAQVAELPLHAPEHQDALRHGELL